MTGLRIGHPQEEHRVLGDLAAGLLHVIAVVETDAPDLAGVRYHRQQRDLGQREVGRARGGPPRLAQRAGLQQALQI